MVAATLLATTGMVGLAATVQPAPSAEAASDIGSQGLRQANTFYAYTNANESLDASIFVKGRWNGTPSAVLTATSPDGEVTSCETPADAPLDFTCDLGTLTSTSAGIWTVDFFRPGGNGGGGSFGWNLSVTDQSGTEIPGRVWSNDYIITDQDPNDFSLWYVGAFGHQYQADYSELWGIDSRYRANQFGVVNAGTCESAYQSLEGGGPFLDPGLILSGTECGAPYNIFFETPSPDLPASATDHTGTTRFVSPLVAEPTLADLQFSADSAQTREGTFTFQVENHVGNAELLIDADGDGNYDGPLDRTIPIVIDGSGQQTIDFDGLDGEGNPISSGNEFSATVRIAQAGEIHFIMSDIESLGGTTVTALNGPEAGSSTLYWNDSNLQSEQRLQECLPTQLDGSAGVDSAVAGGVHGWPCWGLDANLNPNDFVTGPWGDVRDIDLWTFNSQNLAIDVVVPAEVNYTVTKSSDPASGTAVQSGDTVTYTIDVEQFGNREAVAELTDDLSDVLDDATYNNDVSATAGTVDITESTLSWSGTLPVGGSATITYSVTVNDLADLPDGNYSLGNVVTSPGCPPGECETTHPVGSYTVEKSSDPASGSDVAVGDTITYSVTVSQAGEAAIAATLSDNLADVLDDATYNDDVTASLGEVAFDESTQTLSWNGNLEPGDMATITYSVTVTGAGDTTLTNVVTSPGCPTADDCTTTHQTGTYTVEKSADPASGTTVAAGQVIDYTITVTQAGEGAVAASLSDDMTAVLDDAVFNNDAQASAGELSVEDGILTWSGTLEPGAVVTITYSVTVSAVGTGDGTLDNIVTSDGCPTEEDCRTNHQVGEYVFDKTSDPESGSTVDVGDVVTYTITVTHTGVGVVTGATLTDDMSNLLDDADFNNDASATSGSITRDGETLTWTGDLEMGDVVTITYSVTVTGAGDGELANVVTSDDPRGGCVANDPCRTDHDTPPGVGGSDPNDPNLAHTGGQIAGWTVLAALLLIGTGAAITLAKRRKDALPVE